MGRGEVKLNSNEDLDDQCQFVRASKRKGAATAYSEKRLVIRRYLHDSTSFLSQISDSLKKCLDLVRLSRNVPLTLRFKQLHPRPRVARLIRESRGEGPLGCRLLARDLRDWLHSRPRQHLLMMERNGISISFLKPSDWREQFLVPARIVLKMCFISLYLEMASDLIWRIVFWISAMGPFLHSFSGTWMQINGIHLLLLLGMIFGAQVDVESQQFELYSSQPRLSSMFVSSCLGSQV